MILLRSMLLDMIEVICDICAVSHDCKHDFYALPLGDGGIMFYLVSNS